MTPFVPRQPDPAPAVALLGALGDGLLDDAAARLSSAQAAHDLANFLQVTQSALRLIERALDAATRDGLQPVLAAAAGSLQRAAEVGRGMFHEGGDPALVPVSPSARLIAMADALAVACGPDVALELALDDAAPRFLCDPVQFDSAVLNLVINAGHAMPQGGRIRIAVSRGDAPRGGGPATMVSVADTGCGMAADLSARIFEPYVTTRGGHGGSGLGLAAVERAVRTAGGSAEVRSEPGLGSVFVLTFPALLASRAEDAACAPQAA